MKCAVTAESDKHPNVFRVNLDVGVVANPINFTGSEAPMEGGDEKISVNARRSSAVVASKHNDPACPQTLQPLHRSIDGMELLKVVDNRSLFPKSFNSGQSFTKRGKRSDDRRSPCQNFANLFHIAFGYLDTSDADLSM